LHTFFAVDLILHSFWVNSVPDKGCIIVCNFEFPEYVIAPVGWTWCDGTFAADGSYEGEWSCFCLLDQDDDTFFTGRSERGLWGARLGRKVTGLKERLVDFLQYENAHGRKVILSFPPDIDVDHFVKQAFDQVNEMDAIRPNDPQIIIHSTTLKAWDKIQSDGELRAASLLPQPHHSQGLSEMNEIEKFMSNEPSEYDEYIMFGPMNSPWPELVVASHAAGCFLSNEQVIYQPGVRLYLDHHHIIYDGLATRDGLHLSKAHWRLPLKPYLLASVGVEDLDPLSKTPFWTPRLFVDQSNRYYMEKTGISGH
jgi:hypothetical protein